jgi:OOP family OmpA-OmpF porin
VKLKQFLRPCVAGFIVASLGISAGASAQGSATGAYAVNNAGQVYRNAAGQCWRTIQWSTSTASEECDPDAVPRKTVAAPPPAPVAAVPVAAPALVPVPAPVVAAPKAAPLPVLSRTENLTLGADASFDSGKVDLKSEGQAKLDQLAAKLKGMQIGSIAITGYTDNVGSDALNQRLSLRRAEAVKAYLVAKGVEAAKIRTAGRGKASPVADNKSAMGRAKNRRVDVDIKAVRTL